ncbi:hypothetical protein HJC23_006847 [Cyclotella cryptica]|uniref:DUF1415 domain-containing protein n=1 Tax=Cyclotella cryptica TaxID=29204 RepID=A0ABD3PH85_9STRA|eukprot:CCRYP_015092-RA/>CCRYP_015092-RA protein AED:0.24 eAED:-0.44 QI:0/-1/0/1/-1/1/1/0/466
MLVMLKGFHPLSLPGRAYRIAAWHFYKTDATAILIGHNELKHRQARLSTRAGMSTSTLVHLGTRRRSYIQPLVNDRRAVFDFRAGTSGRRFGSKASASKKIVTRNENGTDAEKYEQENNKCKDTGKSTSDMPKDSTGSTYSMKQSDTFLESKTDKEPASVKSFKTISTANRKEKGTSKEQDAPDSKDTTQETNSCFNTETDKRQHSIKSNSIRIDDVDENDSGEQTDPLRSSSSSSTIQETNSSESLPTDEIIQSQTMDWITKVVIGYNLCPFAEKPIRLNIFTSVIARGTNTDSILSTVLQEMNSRTQKPGASLVICPDYSPENFETFMSLMNQLEDMPEFEQEFESKLSALPFHPLYEFEPQEEYGNDSNSIENYVYRSPHPMILILRRTEVERALEKLEWDASEVSYRNLVLLKSAEEKMGREKFVKVMRGEYVREMDVLMSYWKYIGYIDDPNKFKRGKGVY